MSHELDYMTNQQARQAACAHAQTATWHDLYLFLMQANAYPGYVYANANIEYFWLQAVCSGVYCGLRWLVMSRDVLLHSDSQLEARSWTHSGSLEHATGSHSGDASAWLSPGPLFLRPACRINKHPLALRNTYQVYERQKLPATSVCLMRGHVYGFVIADDGEIGQENSYSEDLGWDERHVYFPLLCRGCCHLPLLCRRGRRDAG